MTLFQVQARILLLSRDGYSVTDVFKLFIVGCVPIPSRLQESVKKYFGFSSRVCEKD